MTTYPTGVVSALLQGIDGVLNARDAVGAIIQPISIVTRTWYTDSGLTVAATQPEGFATDSVSQILPSPGMKEFNQDIRLREGGAVKAGDIILTNISRNKYRKSDLDNTGLAANVEKLYLIGDKLYQVINITEKYVTFSVQVRELSKQERY